MLPRSWLGQRMQFDQLKRREFITLLGGAATAWPLAARAQRLPVVGFLSSRSPGESAGLVAAFRRGLSEAGFIEGQNLVIAFRWAEGRYDRLAALAAELVALRVAVLLAAGGPPSAFAAKAATATIPIVFSAVNDPVRLGLIASLNRPGGNVTGMSMFTSELVLKSMQLLRELVPTAVAIGYLMNPSNPSAEIYSKEAGTAASALGVQVQVLNASTEHDLDQAFASLEKLGAGGLVVPGEPFFDSQRDRIAALSARYAVAAIYPFREYVLAGGLMSYGASLTDSYRQAAIYVGRVLKGEKPEDLPVMQPTKFELVLNLKTFKALHLEIPDKLLALADEVIE
jgi:putative ABC transport system substrate-binding protein